MSERTDILEILAEAGVDVKAGRVALMENTFTNLRAMFKTVVKD